MMDSTQTPRAWIESCGITAAALEGRNTADVYDDYATWTRGQRDFPRGYTQWLGSIAAILPALTLEAGTDADGRPQTYFATIGGE